MKTFIFTSACLALTVWSAQAATVTIGGGSFSSLLDREGNLLPDGSIVQVGYFLGVEATKSGAEFNSSDWNSFTAFIGIDSLSPAEDVRTMPIPDFGLQAVFQFGSTFETNSPVLPDNYPVRLGFRIFNAQGDTTAGSSFNTVVRDVSTWQFNNPVPVGDDPPPRAPSPTIGSEADILMFWQDSANPFRTTLVPEPSTSLSLLLGLTFLAGNRRRR